MTAASIKVMLVDDHTVVTDGLAVLLNSFDDIDVVGAVNDGADAGALYETTAPDVVLVDLSMPGMDGVAVTHQLRSIDHSARIVALTAYLDQGLVHRVLEAGALGYLLKSVGGTDLAAAVRQAADGRPVLSSEALGELSSGNGTRPGDDLTPREREVLAGLVDGLSNKQIAASLGLKAGTVRIYVSHILDKLGVANRTAAAKVAHEHGLVRSSGTEHP